MSESKRTAVSQYSEQPKDCWVGNYQLDRLRTWFYDAGGRVGTPMRPDGTLDPAQEVLGFVGVFAPDKSTAEKWRTKDISKKSTFEPAPA